MLALTLWRPWSCAIVRGPKPIENRGWRPPRYVLGQVIAIHAGKTWAPDAVEQILSLDLWPDVPRTKCADVANFAAMIADNVRRAP